MRGRFVRRGGQGEGEDTEGMLDHTAFWRDLGCWRGGHGGPIVFVGGQKACIGCRVRRWESLVVADQEVVGRRGDKIHLWSRIWDLFVVAELLVVGGEGSGNNVLWRS